VIGYTLARDSVPAGRPRSQEVRTLFRAQVSLSNVHGESGR
jgi:hypothetical protein